MKFFYNSLGENGDIEVYNDKLFLRAKKRNLFYSYYKFYKDEKIIFESRLTYFFIWRKVKILYQNLVHSIISIETSKLRDAILFYDISSLRIESHLFNKGQWLLFKDDVEIGSIQTANNISVGAKFNIEIDTTEEIIALYFLILFTSSLAFNIG